MKSPVLNLEDIEWKNLVMHWSRSQDEVLSIKSHDNLNFYFSAYALQIFFAGNLLEEEFRFEKDDRISQIRRIPHIPSLCSVFSFALHFLHIRSIFTLTIRLDNTDGTEEV